LFQEKRRWHRIKLWKRLNEKKKDKKTHQGGECLRGREKRFRVLQKPVCDNLGPVGFEIQEKYSGRNIPGAERVKPDRKQEPPKTGQEGYFFSQRNTQPKAAGKNFPSQRKPQRLEKSNEVETSRKKKRRKISAP